MDIKLQEIVEAASTSQYGRLSGFGHKSKGLFEPVTGREGEFSFKSLQEIKRKWGEKDVLPHPNLLKPNRLLYYKNIGPLVGGYKRRYVYQERLTLSHQFKRYLPWLKFREFTYNPIYYTKQTYHKNPKKSKISSTLPKTTVFPQSFHYRKRSWNPELSKTDVSLSKKVTMGAGILIPMILLWGLVFLVIVIKIISKPHR